MLFFPFKADVILPGIPVLTILISLLCLVIFWQQTESNARLVEYADAFCARQDSRIDKVILDKIASPERLKGKNICEGLYLVINASGDKDRVILEIAQKTPKFSTKTAEQSAKYVSDYLTNKLAEFEKGAPHNLTSALYYDPASFNVLKMITSAFSHGSWSHVIGNLFFFFAFAATLEAILGILYYPLVILGLAIGTNIVYSFAVMASPEAMPTLGLSGVVMGAMGLFTYFLPAAKIRCFFWFITFIRRFGVYAWILALWYFGWDVYDLYVSGTSGSVNLVAHVSGFVIGYVMGLLLFKWRKRKVIAAIR